MTLKRYIAPVVLAGLVAAASAVFAQVPANTPDGAVSGFDRAAAVTFADTVTRAEGMFQRLDANHDGQINRADRAALRKQMRDHAFDGMDANRDGELSRDEFGSRPPSPPAADGKTPPVPPMAGGGMRGMHGMRGSGMMLLGMADANHDKTITRPEFDAAVKARFDAADTDHDGTLNAAERQAQRERTRGEFAAHHPGRGPGGGRMDHPGMGEPGMMPPPPED